MVPVGERPCSDESQSGVFCGRASLLHGTLVCIESLSNPFNEITVTANIVQLFMHVKGLMYYTYILT